MDDEAQERHLNIHLDPEHLAGVYSNFANVSFSSYEFTITFARIDHEVEEGDVPGVVVSRINMAPQFMRELLDAMNDSWSRYSTAQGIRDLPGDRRPLISGRRKSRIRSRGSTTAWHLKAAASRPLPRRSHLGPR